MELDYKAIGRRLSEARQELGLKQSEASEKANITDKYLSNIETAKNKPSLKVLAKLCKALNVPMDYIVYGEAVSKDISECTQLAQRISKLDNQKRDLTNRFLDILEEK